MTVTSTAPRADAKPPATQPTATGGPELTRPLKILVFSTLFPNAARPTHGIFVETRLRHLVASGQVDVRVVAPVPWFPLKGTRWGLYGAYAAAPRTENRHDVAIVHPRYLVIPKVGMSVTPATLYAGAVGAVQALRQGGFDFDLIDAHYAYPDGVAAAMLARRFKVPVTITARGSDLNVIPRYARPRAMIRRMAASADGLITVCQALKDIFVDLGAPAENVRVLRNGVDLTLFQPQDRMSARSALGLGPDPVMISVGNLVPGKGTDLTVRALARLPAATLLIVGDGPEQAALTRLAADTGVSDRVRFLGRRPPDRLAALYSAADVLVLASGSEGWANVLLEAMACGTPVVASAVGGTPEVVAAPEAGRLISERTPEAIADAVSTLLADPPLRAAVRAYAERFNWDETTAGQLTLFRSILAQRRGQG